LFVDDESKILEGLQRMLRPERHRWEMAFASGGAAALSLLEAASVRRHRFGYAHARHGRRGSA
jgi:CheY-like chemotaxis protein